MLLLLLVIAGRLLMPFMGQRLIRSEALRRSDAIVVLASMRLERTFEAAALYREGWAPSIILMRAPDLVRDRLREQLHIRVPVYLDLQKDVLRQLGVPASAIEASPGLQESTRQEAAAISAIARQRGLRRVIVVTSPYHTARAGGLVDRAAGGSFEVIVHPDRYEPVAPNRWWVQFPDKYDVVYEYLNRAYALIW